MPHINDHQARVHLCRLCVLAAMIAPGCGLTSKSVKENRLHYNDAMVHTDRTELLLNIVRLRYLDTPEWLVPNSISVQNTLSADAGVSGTLVEFGGDILGLSAGGRWSETPTVSYSPGDERFVRALLAPITPQTVFLFSYGGWGSDRILRLMVDSINGVRNASTGAGPTLRDPPEFAEFLWLVQNMRELEVMRMIDVIEAEAFTPISFPVPIEKLTLSDSGKTMEFSAKILRRLKEEHPEPDEVSANDALSKVTSAAGCQYRSSR